MEDNSTSTPHPQVASNEPLPPTLDSSQEEIEKNLVIDEVEINSDGDEVLSKKILRSVAWKHF